MKISIVTACYNSAKTINDTLRTIQMQTHQDIEHIIIDGGSTDGTLEILEKNRSAIAHLTSEPDNGLYDAMNRGIAKATGDIIGLLNSDDMLAHNRVLSEVVSSLSNPDIDACYGDLVYVDQDNTNKIVRYWKSNPYNSKLLANGWIPAHPTFYAKKEVHERFGMYFNTDYKLAADYELLLRLLFKHQIRVDYIPDVMIKMRLGGTTNKSFKNIINQNKEIFRALTMHNYKHSPIKLICSKLFNRIQQYQKQTNYAKVILITGISGFIGKALLKKLSELGYQVKGTLRSEHSHRVMSQFIKQYHLANVSLYNLGELSNQTNWDKILDNIDVIVHCAARAHILKETHPEPLIEFRKSNYLATEHLIEQAIKKKVKRFIFISSIGVLGNTSLLTPFSIKSIPNPQLPYAQSKWEAEQVVNCLSAEIETVIINHHWYMVRE